MSRSNVLIYWIKPRSEPKSMSKRFGILFRRPLRLRRAALPERDVLDRFHITTHLNQAVDQVRRAESRQECHLRSEPPWIADPSVCDDLPKSLWVPRQRHSGALGGELGGGSPLHATSLTHEFCYRAVSLLSGTILTGTDLTDPSILTGTIDSMPGAEKRGDMSFG